MKITASVAGAAAVLIVALAAFPVSAGATLTSLFSFNATNGAFPSGTLIQTADGNFYGTTTGGGAAGQGSAFRFSPTGTLSPLVAFNGTNGAAPRAGLILGADDLLYGVTYHGGSHTAGTLFQLTTNGALTTLISFAFGDSAGAYPIAELRQGQDGNIYGATAIGGTNNGGTVFQLMTNSTIVPLVSFALNGDAGNSPYAGLVQGNNGVLYGSTYMGGTNGNGTLFSLTTNGAFQTLYSFTGTSDGANPFARLIQDAAGNLYGTTFYGGSHDYGTVFKLATNGALTTLLSFANTNGAYPQAGLVLGTRGELYGTTSAGGAYTNESGQGYGTVFMLETNGLLTMLAAFNGTNGATPEAGLTRGADGLFYGTTTYGGTHGYGTMFRLSLGTTPPSFVKLAGTDTAVVLTWNATVGQSYQMLYKTNLSQPGWNHLNGPLTATNAVMTTLDPLGPDQQRLYRILQLD